MNKHKKSRQELMQGFRDAWQAASSVAEVAQAFGITPGTASVRASNYRKHGIPLKFMRGAVWPALANQGSTQDQDPTTARLELLVPAEKYGELVGLTRLDPSTIASRLLSLLEPGVAAESTSQLTEPQSREEPKPSIN